MMASVHEMHQRAGKQEQVWHGEHHMVEVIDEEVEAERSRGDADSKAGR
jgi:hypothetical protein